MLRDLLRTARVPAAAAVVTAAALLAPVGLAPVAGAVTPPGSSTTPRVEARAAAVDLDGLRTGAAPRLSYLRPGAVVPPGSPAVRLGLPRGQRDVELYGVRRTTFVVRATSGRGSAARDTLFAVSQEGRRTRALDSYPVGRRTYESALLPPAVDRYLLVDDGADGSSPQLRQIAFRTGRDAVKPWSPGGGRIVVAGLTDKGPVVEVADRLVLWTFEGRRVTFLPASAGPAGATPFWVDERADLVGYVLPGGRVSFNRLSMPDDVVWTQPADAPSEVPLAVTEDGARVLVAEGDRVVSRRSSDGDVLSSLDLTSDRGRVRLGHARFETARRYLVEVTIGAAAPRLLRCLPGGCQWTTPAGRSATLERFGREDGS